MFKESNGPFPGLENMDDILGNWRWVLGMFRDIVSNPLQVILIMPDILCVLKNSEASRMLKSKRGRNQSGHYEQQGNRENLHVPIPYLWLC